MVLNNDKLHLLNFFFCKRRWRLVDWKSFAVLHWLIVDSFVDFKLLTALCSAASSSVSNITLCLLTTFGSHLRGSKYNDSVLLIAEEVHSQAAGSLDIVFFFSPSLYF